MRQLRVDDKNKIFRKECQRKSLERSVLTIPLIAYRCALPFFFCIALLFALALHSKAHVMYTCVYACECVQRRVHSSRLHSATLFVVVVFVCSSFSIKRSFARASEFVSVSDWCARVCNESELKERGRERERERERISEWLL